MITLTQEQMRALENADTTPPRVVNPQTHETFVLVPLAEYAHLTEDEYDDSPWTDQERDLLRSQACEILDGFGKGV